MTTIDADTLAEFRRWADVPMLPSDLRRALLRAIGRPMPAPLAPRAPAETIAAKARRIMAAVLEVTGADESEVRGNGRHAVVVTARELMVHMLRERTRYSYPEIAKVMGRPNHSTVLTAHHRMLARIAAGEVAVLALLASIRKELDSTAEGGAGANQA